MHRRTLTGSALVAAAALLLAACAPTDAVTKSAVSGVYGDSANPAVTLTLADNGFLSGNDGCNSLRGEWTLTEGVVGFGDVASTLMGCEGVDTWLSGLVTATPIVVDGDIVSLEVHGADGSTLGELEYRSN